MSLLTRLRRLFGPVEYAPAPLPKLVFVASRGVNVEGQRAFQANFQDFASATERSLAVVDPRCVDVVLGVVDGSWRVVLDLRDDACDDAPAVKRPRTLGP